MLGITAKTVSPIRPREADVKPEELTEMSKPARLTSATHTIRFDQYEGIKNVSRTAQKNAIGSSDQSPRIWRPICMIQTSLEWE